MVSTPFLFSKSTFFIGEVTIALLSFVPTEFARDKNLARVENRPDLIHIGFLASV
jgi:hypothetical protein